MQHDEASKSFKLEATLTVGQNTINIPLICGSEGEVALDIRKLRSDTKGLAINGQDIQGGLVSFDPGYKNTASCQSDITFIDGEHGILRYRGYDIAELAAKKIRFIETALLLIYGELPTQEEREHFRQLLTQSELLHEGMMNFFYSLPDNADPMAILAAAVQTSSLYYPELRSIDPGNDDCLRAAAAKLLSKVRTIAAFSYRKAMGLPFEYPDPSLDYCSNFLHMMFSIPKPTFLCHRHHGPGLEPVPDITCRSRTELFHRHRQNGGLVPGQSLRLDLRRHFGLVRTRCTAAPTSKSYACWKISRPAIPAWKP